MYKISILIILIAAGVISSAQSLTTVTASNVLVDNGSGTAVNPPAGSRLCFLGVDNLGVAITYTPSGGSPVTAGTPVCQTLTSGGALTGTLQVANAALASPNGLYFTITVVNGSTIYLTIPITSVSGTLFNYDAYGLQGTQQALGIGFAHLACSYGARWTSTSLPAGVNAQVCNLAGQWQGYPPNPYCPSGQSYVTPQSGGTPFCVSPSLEGLGAPSGFCTEKSTYLQIDSFTNFYACKNGAWALIGSGGGGGCSVSGSAGQIVYNAGSGNCASDTLGFTDGSGNWTAQTVSTTQAVQGTELFGEGSGTITPPVNAPTNWGAIFGPLAATFTSNYGWQWNGTAPSSLSLVEIPAPSTVNGQSQALITYEALPLSVAHGGTGTGSPGLVAGTNVTVTGSWPNQTINAAGTSSSGSVTYTTSQNASSSDNGKVVVMNCASACSYTLPATQPSSTWSATFQTIGTANATIVLGGSDTFNGGSSAPVPNKFRLMKISADSATATNYVGEAPLAMGTNMNAPTAAANAFTLNATTQAGSSGLATCSDTSGSGTVQSCTLSGSATFSADSCFLYTTTTANTGALTLNVNSFGALPVEKWLYTTALASGDLAANSILTACVNHAQSVVNIEDIANPPSGGSGNFVNLCSAVTLTNATCSGGIISITAGNSSFTIASIPGTYINLRFTAILRSSSTSGTASHMGLRFNGDTGNNYSDAYGFNGASNGQGSDTTQSSLYIGLAATANTASGASSTIDGVVPFYAQTTFNKNTQSRGDWPTETWYGSGQWANTAAVTSITFLTQDSSNFITGSKITLYGTN